MPSKVKKVKKRVERTSKVTDLNCGAASKHREGCGDRLKSNYHLVDRKNIFVGIDQTGSANQCDGPPKVVIKEEKPDSYPDLIPKLVDQAVIYETINISDNEEPEVQRDANDCEAAIGCFVENCYSANGLSLQEQAMPTKCLPEEVKVFLKKDKCFVEGGFDEKRNSVTSLINFMVSVPEDSTKFWQAPDCLESGRGVLEIINSKLKYTIENLGCPGVSVDLFEMYEIDSRFSNEVLASKRVWRGWDPTITNLSMRYKINRRLSNYTLKSNESIQFCSNSSKVCVDVAKLSDRSYIPCYLAIFTGTTWESKIKISLKNRIAYKVAESNGIAYPNSNSHTTVTTNEGAEPKANYSDLNLSPWEEETPSTEKPEF